MKVTINYDVFIFERCSLRERLRGMALTNQMLLTPAFSVSM